MSYENESLFLCSMPLDVNISYSHFNFITFSFLAYYNSIATFLESYAGASAVSKKSKRKRKQRKIYSSCCILQTATATSISVVLKIFTFYFHYFKVTLKTKLNFRQIAGVQILCWRACGFERVDLHKSAYNFPLTEFFCKISLIWF